MKYSIEAYNIHELGQRQNQEDSLFPALGKSTADDRLFILCDGMGGHEKGEVASATVCEAISKTILSRWNTDEPLSDELLLQAINAAYDALDAKDDNATKKMGTTLTLLCLHANGATVAHIGDSRVYQFRPDKGIVFRTEDHSLVNDLIKIGEITEEEAKHHPQKNVITRAMQPHQPHRAKADIAHLTDIQSGDYFFLCSDGMLEQTSDENLVNVITKSGIPITEKVERLRSLTEENSDNHTAHLIYISKVNDAIKSSTQAQTNNAPKGMWVNVDVPTTKSKLKKRLLFSIVGVVSVVVLAFVGILSYKMIWSADKIQDKAVKEQRLKHRKDTTVNTKTDSLKTATLKKATQKNDTSKKAKTFIIKKSKETKLSPKHQ